MSIFAGKQVYGEKWQEVSRRKFTAEELAEVKSAVVVDSEYRASACFFMAVGGTVYIPMSTNSNYKVGETLDLNTVDVVTLKRNGETIERIE